MISSFKRLTSVLAVVACGVAGYAGAAVLDQAEGRHPDKPASPDVGTLTRETAPDIGPEDREWFSPTATDADIERWRSLAEQPTHVRARVEQDQRMWVDTCATFEDLYFVKDARLACADAYGYFENSCWYHLTHVVRRQSSKEGRIVYTRAELAERVQDEPADNDPGCVLYVNCLAAARLGEVVPLPPTGEAELALQQSLNSGRWNEEQLADPDKLRLYAQALSEGADHQVAEGRNETAAEQAKVESLRRRVRYLEERAAQLEAVAKGGR